jgi:large subunit ribosomal protein L29
MKAKEVHELKTDELISKLSDLKEELFKLRFSHTTGQLSNPLQMVKCKKDIARVKTVLREREIKASFKNAKVDK